MSAAKRYFVSTNQPVASNGVGEFHWVPLPQSGYAVVLVNGDDNPDPTWNELPHVYGSRGTPATWCGAHGVINDGCTFTGLNGVAKTDDTYTAATKVMAMHPMFRP